MASKTDKAASASGSFAGGFFNNPGAVILGALAIGLLFFGGDIRKAFGSLGSSLGAGLGDINVNLPSINLPDINFPDFNFEFPSFDFGNIFGGVQESLDTIVDQFSNPDLPGRDPGTLTPESIDVIPDTTGGLADRQEDVRNFFDVETPLDPTDPPLVQLFRPADFSDERTDVSFGREIIVPIGDELDLGGGPSFIGGTTTFGDNLIDTFGEVLNIFPFLRANQIDDLLLQNPGLTGSQFRLINPIPETSLSSAGEDPNQILLNAGEFSGLTPEQISLLLTGGNIINF